MRCMSTHAAHLSLPHVGVWHAKPDAARLTARHTERFGTPNPYNQLQTTPDGLSNRFQFVHQAIELFDVQSLLAVA